MAVGPRSARPTAKGKKRAARSDDMMDVTMRKLDKWLDRNPWQAIVVMVILMVVIAFGLWNVFGSTLQWAYGKYLAERVDPWLAAHVTPHFTALWELAREKIPFVDKLKQLFTARSVVEAAGEAAKEL
mmetsp:Transcript_1923/g.4351  ORF Transcript_1923/g.4351 Transcript_1923/m.4351 type:complete len:128 (-) Transcript_1923:214-597(-)